MNALTSQHLLQRALQAVPIVGREPALKQLTGALTEAREGKRALVLVQGEAGVGKTSLVQQLEAPTHDAQGHFVRGHFALLQKHTPYLSMLTALRELLQQLLAEDHLRLLYWRTRLKQALGEGDGVLVPLLPELGYLLKEALPPPPLPPQEERNRTHKAFSDLFRGLSSPKHPLVLFVDDLQWADQASLELIESLAADLHIRGFVLIASARTDEEGDSSLTSLRAAIEARELSALTLNLLPLTEAELRVWLEALFRRAPDNVATLAQALWKKTAGNPFFVRILLEQMHQEQLLWREEERWLWKTSQLRSLSVTDNVASLLIDGLKQQDASTKRILQLGACLGQPFGRDVLGGLLGASGDALDALLLPCLEQGLLVPEGALLRFSHDRMLEAAYALMSEPFQAKTHLQVGRFLLALEEDPTNSERLYDIIRHLQKGLGSGGASLAPEERSCFVSLALAAGQRAQQKGAFETSVELLEWGLSLLGPRRWEEAYEETLSLTHLIAEVGVGCRRRERIEEANDALLTHGKTLVDQLPGWRSRILILIHEDKLGEALDVTNQFFALTHTPLVKPQHPLRLLWDVIRTFWLLGRRQPEDLKSLPEATDPLMRGILDLQVEIAMAYSLHIPEVAPTMIMRDLRGALQHGLTGKNVQCWTGLGLFYGMFGKVDLAKRYGALSQVQLEQMGRLELIPFVNIFVLFATRSLSTPLRVFGEESSHYAKQALSVGDLPSSFHHLSVALFAAAHSGTTLPVLHSLAQNFQQSLRYHQYDINQFLGHMLDQFASLLMAEDVPSSIELEVADKTKLGELLMEWVYPPFQLLLYLLFGRTREAFVLAGKPFEALRNPISTLYRGPYWTYALISLYEGIVAGHTTPWQCRKWLRFGWKQLRHWSRHLPERAYRLIVTEYQLHHLTCPNCQTNNHAKKSTPPCSTPIFVVVGLKGRVCVCGSWFQDCKQCGGSAPHSICS